MLLSVCSKNTKQKCQHRYHQSVFPLTKTINNLTHSAVNLYDKYIVTVSGFFPLIQPDRSSGSHIFSYESFIMLWFFNGERQMGFSYTYEILCPLFQTRSSPLSGGTEWSAIRHGVFGHASRGMILYIVKFKILLFFTTI